MWMEEKLGTRINHERVGEAAAASADLLCVACPFCNTMLSDAVQDLGLEARLPVMDIAEIAMESLS
jgi:Fe-S oxidoreductase